MGDQIVAVLLTFSVLGETRQDRLKFYPLFRECVVRQHPFISQEPQHLHIIYVAADWTCRAFVPPQVLV